MCVCVCDPQLATVAAASTVSAVSDLVVAQSVVAAKRAFTHSALVRFLARVAAPMCRQAAGRRESLLAHRALVRFLTGV